MTPEQPEALRVAFEGAALDFDDLERWAKKLDLGELLARARDG